MFAAVISGLVVVAVVSLAAVAFLLTWVRLDRRRYAIEHHVEFLDGLRRAASRAVDQQASTDATRRL